MATDNTVEVGFTADTSAFTDGVATAGQALDALKGQLDASFADAGSAVEAATGPLQSLSAGLGQVRDSLVAAMGPQVGDQIRQTTATLTREAQRYDQAVIDGAAKAADAQIATARAVVDEKKALGQISADDAIQQLQGLAQEEHAINAERIAGVRDVAQAGGNGTGAVRADTDQIAEAERFNQQMIKLNTEAAQQSSQAWEKSFQPISKAFTTSIDGMVRGTQTFQQTVQRAAQNIVAEYADSAAQSTLKWLETEAQKTAAVLIGSTERLSADQQGQD